MYGIRFNVPNAYGQILERVLRNVKVEDYDWFIEYEDILVEPVTEGKNLFDEKVLTGVDFKRQIRTGSYYVVFLRLYAFPAGAKITPINSFKEYFSSDCELMIFFTDAIFVDLYAKKEDFLEKICWTAQEECFTEMEFIDEFGGKDNDLLPQP